MKKKLSPGSSDIRENISAGSDGFYFISLCTQNLVIIEINLILLLHNVDTAGDFQPPVPTCRNMNKRQ